MNFALAAPPRGDGRKHNYPRKGERLRTSATASPSSRAPGSRKSLPVTSRWRIAIRRGRWPRPTHSPLTASVVALGIVPKVDLDAGEDCVNEIDVARIQDDPVFRERISHAALGESDVSGWSHHARKE